MRTLALAALSLAAVGAACTTARKAEPVPEARPVAARTEGPRPPGGAPGQPPARRQPVPPPRQDSLRKAAVAEILATLAGRENEPAGTVFRNVKLHREMPAKEFLAMMDEQMGRGLGFTCTNCHMDNKDYASDERKNKVIARQMVRMQHDIDAKYIAKVKELDEEKPKTTCVMCHRGVAHMPNTMDVPATTPPSRKR